MSTKYVNSRGLFDFDLSLKSNGIGNERKKEKQVVIFKPKDKEDENQLGRGDKLVFFLSKL